MTDLNTNLQDIGHLLTTLLLSDFLLITYLSYKYGLIEADWFTPLFHLLGKVKKKMLLLHPHPLLCGILKELCGILDNTSSCDIANNSGIVALINAICTSN